MATQPYGLVDPTAVYQYTLRELYANQIGHIYPLFEPDLPITDQFAPAINMVQIW